MINYIPDYYEEREKEKFKRAVVLIGSIVFATLILLISSCNQVPIPVGV